MGTLISDGGVSIRAMLDEEADYALLVRWRAQPHVREWWDPDDPPPGLAQIEAEYGPEGREGDPVIPCIIEHEGRPAGYVQLYRWADHAEAAREMDVPHDDGLWGIDIMIGEPDLIGHGLGPRAIDLACRYMEDEHGATAVVLTTEVTNHRAQAAYERAGFRKIREVLELDTRDGERVRCWLMIRPSGATGATTG